MKVKSVMRAKTKSRRRITTSQLKRTLCFGIVVSILGLTTGVRLGTARPRPEKANWENVKQLLPSEEVKVVLKDAKPHRGLLQTVTDEDLVLRLATGEQKFARQDILRVSSKGQSHRGRNAATGAAIGALAMGAAAAGAIGSGWGMLLGLPGGGLGAIVGAVLPTGGWRDVYRVSSNEHLGQVRSRRASPASGR
jgi:hypothetical protein